MLNIESTFYTAKLRWKMGERAALGALSQPSKDRLLPHIVMPPLTVREIETQRFLSRDEFTRFHIGRLQQNWYGRPILIDFGYLVFDPDDRGSDAGRINEFLAMSRAVGCKLLPVFDCRVDSYRLGALAAHAHNTRSGAAIQITLNDLQDDRLPEMLNTLMTGIGIRHSDCVLIVDLCEAAIFNVFAFSTSTNEWLAKLHQLGLWKRIIVEASNYPTRNPAQPNKEKIVPRNEWLSWVDLIQKDRAILNWASFGDFGADHGQIDFEGGGRTVIHLRYATAENWIVQRGGDPTDQDDGTIQSVARRIIRSGEFMGEEYSDGDAFISRCAAGNAHGNASTWRWANMVHHMTQTIFSIGDLIGQPVEHVKRVPAPEQLPLLAVAK